MPPDKSPLKCHGETQGLAALGPAATKRPGRLLTLSKFSGREQRTIARCVSVSGDKLRSMHVILYGLHFRSLGAPRWLAASCSSSARIEARSVGDLFEMVARRERLATCDMIAGG